MGKRVNTAVWMEKYNRWQVNVQKDGKRRSFTSSTPGRTGQREANKKADEWLDQGIEGGNKRVEALYDEYVEYMKKTTSQSNWKPIESKGKTWIIPAIGNKKISSLTEHDLQKIIDEAHIQKRSRKTLMNIRAVLSNFLKYCRKARYPAPTVEDLTIPEGARYKEKNIVQPDGLRILFSVDTTIRKGKTVVEPYIHAYRFQILTGLRPGELMGLCWKDIDGNLIYIKRAINKYGEETRGKNNNAIRKFILTEKSMEVLNNQRKDSENVTPDDRVFPVTQSSNYLKHWKKYCEINGIPQTTVYELRHTFVSLAKNLPEGQVKAIVGHSANMDTFGIYSHEVIGDIEKAASGLEKIFDDFLDLPPTKKK